MNNDQFIANTFEDSNNPLIDAAKPVFIMANSMHSTTSQLPLESLLNKYSIVLSFGLNTCLIRNFLPTFSSTI